MERRSRARGWKVWTEPSGADSWRCRWRGKYGGGQETFIYKADAVEKCDEKMQDFQRRDAGLPPKPKATSDKRVSEWAAEWLAKRAKNPRQNTYLNFDKPTIEQFVEWVNETYGDTDLGSLTETDAYAWLDWLEDEYDYNPTTVRSRGAHLRPAIKWAKRRGWIKVNFMADVELPKGNEPGRVLTHEEIEIACTLPPPHVAAGFALLLNSGMRKGEVVSLRKSQVEPRAEPQLWRVHFEKYQTKNGKPKSVVLNPRARAIVEAAMRTATSDRVFELITKDVFDYWIRKVQEKIGPVRIHDFKHTFCTHWMRDTGDKRGLQQMTGNSEQSLRIYDHLALETPRGMDNFKGLGPFWPLKATAAHDQQTGKTLEI